MRLKKEKRRIKIELENPGHLSTPKPRPKEKSVPLMNKTKSRIKIAYYTHNKLKEYLKGDVYNMDRSIKSHVDIEKLERFPYAEPFEYKDIVNNEFHPGNKQPIDEEKFKEEVQKGMYSGINVIDDTGITTVYKKNKI